MIRGRLFLPVTAATLAALTVAWRALTFTGFTNDQYVHLALAQQVLLGDWPLRDFHDPGMTLMYLVSAGAWRLFGDAVGVEWAIAAASFAAGSALAAVAATRLSRSAAIAALVTVLLVLLSPRDYSYPKVVLYAIAGVLIVVTAERPTRGRIVSLGVLSSVAFLFRHDHGVYIGLAALATVVMSSGGSPAPLVRHVTILATTVLASLSPWLLYLLFHQPGTYIASAIEFARAEADVTVLDELPRLAMPLSGSENAAAWLFWLFWALPAICTALAAWRRQQGKERWPGETAAVVSLAMLAALVNAGFLRDVLAVRVPDAAVPAALLGAWLLGRAFDWRGRQWRGTTVAAMGTAIVLIAATAVAVRGVANLDELVERTGLVSDERGAVRDSAARARRYLGSSHREMAPSRFSRALIPFFDYLDRCTTRSDRLVITSLFPDILVLAGRGFTGGGVSFALGHASPNRQAETIARLRSRPPLFVLVIDDHEFSGRFPRVAEYVATEYRTLHHWPVPDTAAIRIAVDPRRAPRGTDTATGLACF